MRDPTMCLTIIVFSQKNIKIVILLAFIFFTCFLVLFYIISFKWFIAFNSIVLSNSPCVLVTVMAKNKLK